MKLEDKELLLKDLCARLPYKVKVCDDMKRIYTLTLGTSYLIDLFYSDGDYVDVPIKPYLRPMSSMTEEEKKEYQSLREIDISHDGDDNFMIYYFDNVESVDWLNENMFDFRELIPAGLAIEVTKENNPYKD